MAVKRAQAMVMALITWNTCGLRWDGDGVKRLRMRTALEVNTGHLCTVGVDNTNVRNLFPS